MFRQRSLLLAAVLAVPGVILANEFIPKVPEQCQQMGFCENLPDYPAERVADIIKQLGTELDKYKVQIDASTLLSRNGDEEELCDFKRKTIVPMAAPDTNGQWHYVVNQKEAPLQS
ncbi:uncharacterized protein LOC133533783 [Cydia pomonella]|uniref:uncharacterized protein LOC133533783 n=1 Tax=Cydia pomonella TaxID=82600 RepID=UPI002ADE0656|nr:uncharacterized protein LOC133533783 [Cydia pomonella]